jgi:hypothetical protein
MLVLAGCPAGGAGSADATVDGAGDLTTTETGVDAGGADTGFVDTGFVDTGFADVVPEGPPAACTALGQSCGAGTFCYPFPFAEMATGESRCAAYQPPGVPSPQCDSQVQCPGGSVCATLFSLSTDCHRVCNIDVPACVAGMECIPLAGYPRMGLCL